jgi:hypothetical protein
LYIGKNSSLTLSEAKETNFEVLKNHGCTPPLSLDRGLAAKTPSDQNATPAQQHSRICRGLEFRQTKQPDSSKRALMVYLHRPDGFNKLLPFSFLRLPSEPHHSE